MGEQILCSRTTCSIVLKRPEASQTTCFIVFMCSLRPGGSQTTCFIVLMCSVTSHSTWFIFHAWAYPKAFYQHANAYPRPFLNVWARSFASLSMPRRTLSLLVKMRTHTPDLFYAWARLFCSIAPGHTQVYLLTCERIPQAFFYAWTR